jgi:hypothetical protein
MRIWTNCSTGYLASLRRNETNCARSGLATADDYMIAAMQGVSEWLESKAGVTLDHVDRGNLPGANERIHQARTLAKLPRKRLVDTAAKLRGLEAVSSRAKPASTYLSLHV